MPRWSIAVKIILLVLLATPCAAQTRFYLASTGTAPATPSGWLGWTDTTLANATPLPMSTTKANTSMTTDSFAPASGNPRTSANLRWVSPALAAQTIDGTVGGVMKVREDNNSLSATLAIGIKVIQADGSDRGTLLAVSASDDATTVPPEMPGTAAGSAATRKFLDSAEDDSITLSSVSVTAGDYLVIEVGARTTAGTGGRSAYFTFGDNAGTDYPLADGDTDVENPWVEFTDTITFQPPTGSSSPIFSPLLRSILFRSGLIR